VTGSFRMSGPNYRFIVDLRRGGSQASKPNALDLSAHGFPKFAKNWCGNDRESSGSSARRAYFRAPLSRKIIDIERGGFPGGEMRGNLAAGVPSVSDSVEGNVLKRPQAGVAASHWLW
jgi:hypothetical protein